MSIYIGASEIKDIYVGEGMNDYSAMKGPAPDGFHVPLNTERQAVYNVWTALGGGSSAGANFGIALKLPFAGDRYYSSAGVENQGTYGYYWSSSRYNANNAYSLFFNSSALYPQNNDHRAGGFSVRCFKNSPVVPTSSWTKLYGTSIEAGGIFWSSTEGLISMSSDGQTWITIQDKNLGATTVWNSSNTLSKANCGKYYQWGNNYGFPRTGGASVTTSPRQVDASTYGPGNYYSSSTFIKYNGRWDTTDNGNLRGGETGVVKKGNVKEVYVGTTKVRPTGWQPGANTIAYFPLKEDAVDIKNNISLTSYRTTNYTTIGGVKSAEFTKSNWLYNNNVTYVPQGDVAKTISIWLYVKGGNTSWTGIAQIGGTGAGEVFGLGFYSGTSNLLMTRSWSTSGTYSTPTNTWINVVMTYNNSTWKMYVNNDLKVTWSSTTSPVSGNRVYLGQNTSNSDTDTTFYGNAAEFIIENKARTAQEVVDYYNSTKSNYGL